MRKSYGIVIANSTVHCALLQMPMNACVSVTGETSVEVHLPHEATEKSQTLLATWLCVCVPHSR